MLLVLRKVRHMYDLREKVERQNSLEDGHPLPSAFHGLCSTNESSWKSLWAPSSSRNLLGLSVIGHYDFGFWYSLREEHK